MVTGLILLQHIIKRIPLHLCPENQKTISDAWKLPCFLKMPSKYFFIYLLLHTYLSILIRTDIKLHSNDDNNYSFIIKKLMVEDFSVFVDFNKWS